MFRLPYLGMLKYKPVRFRKPLLPPLEKFIEGECRQNSKNLHCFKAGDLRVNEQPGESKDLLIKKNYFQSFYQGEFE